jgi:DNA polymerase-3 subunit epsilon
VAKESLNGPEFIRRYRDCFAETWNDAAPIDSVRFVVLDCETTGFSPTADRIITIGAVAVQNAEIRLDDCFEALLKITSNTTAVTVHGVTRDDSRKGMDEPDALEKFLAYLKDGVIVGHHIGHDLASLDAGYERHWGLQLSNRWLDTMYLAQHLQKAGAFPNRRHADEFTLDALCEMFRIIPHGRHTASGDAFLTAEVFLRMRSLSLRYGRDQLAGICEPFESTMNI